MEPINALLNIPDEQIERYVDRNTPENYKFIRKVVASYIKAFLKNKDLRKSYQMILDNVNPFSSAFIVNREYHEFSKQFTDEGHLRVWAYSLLRKDWNLFSLISELLNWPFVIRYGTGLSASPILITDEEDISHITDRGYTTDMQTVAAIPIIIFYMRYALDKYYFPDLVQIEGFPEFVDKEKKFISYIKPARVYTLLIGNPFLVYRRVISEPRPVNRGMIVAENSPFESPEMYEELSSMREADIQKSYNKIELPENDDYIITVLQNNGRVKHWRIESRNRIKEIVISPENPLYEVYGVFDFTMDWSILYRPFEVNYCVIDLVLDFRYVGAPSFMSINGDWYDTPNEEYLRDYDGGFPYTTEFENEIGEPSIDDIEVA